VNKLASPIVSNGIPIVIPVGKEPIQSLALGTKIYVNNAGDNTVSVIDAVKNSVIKTIPVGIRPLFMTFSGRILFVLNNQDNTISMIDTSTDTVVKTLSSGGVSPVFAISNGGNFYVLNAKSNSVNIFDINIPQVIGMNVVEAAGKYSQNNSLTIRATFDKELIPGSSMRLTLDTNRVILLDTVEGKNLTGVYTI
jgi:YVTN family beta-propeller protein